MPLAWFQGPEQVQTTIDILSDANITENKNPIPLGFTDRSGKTTSYLMTSTEEGEEEDSTCFRDFVRNGLWLGYSWLLLQSD